MKMKCPYNSFNDCYKTKCPFYMFERVWQGNNNLGHPKYDEKYICGRAKKELNEK